MKKAIYTPSEEINDEIMTCLRVCHMGIAIMDQSRFLSQCLLRRCMYTGTDLAIIPTVMISHKICQNNKQSLNTDIL